MTLRQQVTHLPAVIPPSRRALPRWAPAAAVPVVAGLVLLGVWLAGAVLTEDVLVARALTGAWFAISGALAVLAALRWRRIAVAVVATWFAVSAATGGYLLYASTVDRVVDEDIPAASASTVVASGSFRTGAHPTTGTASLLEVDGQRVVTLTDFDTDPGPDLRVYLAPSSDATGPGVVDLGALKGNIGDQQYAVPDGAPAGSVIVWCRAFSVAFGTADLTG